MFTKYGEAFKLKSTFGKVKDASQNLYVVLLTSVSGLSDSVSACTGYTELSNQTTVGGVAYNNGYARQPLVKWNSANGGSFESVFGNPEEGTGTDAGYIVIKNSTEILFPENYNSTLDANVDLNGGSPIQYFGLVDAASGGNLVAYWDLGADALTITSSDAIAPKIRPGKMVFRCAVTSAA